MTIPWQEAYGAVITKPERIWLKDAAASAAQQFGQPTIVNIGVFECATMYCLRAGAPDAHIVGIDIEPCAVAIHKELRAEFIIADSRICHTNFKSPIHLLFVDGSHKYSVVAADIANWVPKIVPGGVVAFHDYAPSQKHLVKWKLYGVRQAIDEWAATANWKCIPTVGSLAAFQRPK